MYICKYCEKSFKPSYNRGTKETPVFCSRSCKTKDQRGGYKDKSVLEDDIKSVIHNNQRYTTKDEIISKLHISSKTLNRFKVSTLNLNRSCGYTKPRSVFEMEVLIQLEQIFDKSLIVQEKSFEDLKSPRGFPLRFDFYIPDLNILIEADGPHHGNSDHFHGSEYNIECDSIKEEYCTIKGISLIRIPYSRKVNYEYVLKYVASTISL